MLPYQAHRVASAVIVAAITGVAPLLLLLLALGAHIPSAVRVTASALSCIGVPSAVLASAEIATGVLACIRVVARATLLLHTSPCLHTNMQFILLAASHF